MKNPIITILTDFGTKDHYAAVMKGVILSINPRCRLIDISHEIKPQDVEEGAFVLASAYSWFPRGTIHLAVVDPGVGGPRKPILVVTKDYFFVGPDNGIFTFPMRREKVTAVVALTNEKFFLPKLSGTFHGRDLFAPVAAHLSLGVGHTQFGEPLDSWEMLPVPGPVEEDETLRGEVIHVDRFGNLITNIDESRLGVLGGDHRIALRIKNHRIRGLKEGYWQGKKTKPMALIGSGGFLEVSIREGNAQKKLRAGKGDKVSVKRMAHKG